MDIISLTKCNNNPLYSETVWRLVTCDGKISLASLSPTDDLWCSLCICPYTSWVPCECSCSVMSDSFVTPWTAAHWAPLSMGFPRQESWSGLPFPSPGVLPKPGIELKAPALASGFFTTVLPSESQDIKYLFANGFPNVYLHNRFFSTAPEWTTTYNYLVIRLLHRNFPSDVTQVPQR